MNKKLPQDSSSSSSTISWLTNNSTNNTQTKNIHYISFNSVLSSVGPSYICCSQLRLCLIISAQWTFTLLQNEITKITAKKSSNRLRISFELKLYNDVISSIFDFKTISSRQDEFRDPKIATTENIIKFQRSWNLFPSRSYYANWKVCKISLIQFLHHSFPT